MTRPHDRDTATLADRIALAYLSGLSALVLGAMLWVGLFLSSFYLGLDAMPSFAWVIAFALVMAAIGFALLENIVADVIGGLMHGVLKFWRLIAS